MIVAAALSATIGLGSLIDTAWQKSDIYDIKHTIHLRINNGDHLTCDQASQFEDPLSRYYNTEVFCNGKDVDSLPDYLSDEDALKLLNQ